jgi:hypothetical protein
MVMKADDRRVSTEQLRFARVLEAGMRCGLLLLALGFAAYVSGWVPATMPLEMLPQYWAMAADEYRRATGAPEGWGWLARFAAGETLPLAGIVVLCATAPLAFISLLASYVIRRDWCYAAIAALEFAVLALAASGVLTAH